MSADTSDLISHPFVAPPADRAAVEVAEGVYWLRLPLPMALDHVNVYALEDGEGLTVVDTGVHSRRTVAIWEHLLDSVFDVKPVRRVILTHHHPDHVGMVGWFQSRGAELWTTRTAWLMARMLTLDVQEVPTDQAIAFYHAAGMPEAMLEARRNDRPFNFADVVFPLPVGYRRIVDGDWIRIGRRRWLVRTGHGHAPEHATLWSEDGALVLSGDQVISGISSNIGVHPTEPEADPLGDWIESCRRLRQAAKTDQLVLPGHKLPFRGLPARLDQLIENHQSALERLAEELSEDLTAADTIPVLFKRDIGPNEYGLALSEAIAHVNHLGATGRAVSTVGADGRRRWRRAPQTRQGCA